MIKTIFDDGYQTKQYYNETWKCTLDDDKEVPLTLVVEVTNMLDATGEEEFKDYPVTFSIGILNKNIHESIQDNIQDHDNFEVNPSDVIGYYGMNCYLDEKLYDMDMINQKLANELTINQACISNYKCRFTGKEKQYLKFKDENEAFNFADKLVNAYGNTIMSLVGFYLDVPVNLVGETGWKQTEKLELGE